MPTWRNMKIRVGIFGGSGYGGAELLRILLFHPHAEVEWVTANEHAGKSVGEVHRNLNGLTDLSFAKAPEDFESLRELDCVFLALPHGQALEVAPRLPPDVKVVDLSGDFRLDSAEEPAAHTHHPQRSNSFYAYKPFTHQHVPEIEQTLRAVGDWTSDLVFMTHSLPVARGIFASIYVETKRDLTAED